MWGAIGAFFATAPWWVVVWIVVWAAIWLFIIISIIAYVTDGDTISPTDARQMLAGLAFTPFWPLAIVCIPLWALFKLVSIALTKES